MRRSCLHPFFGVLVLSVVICTVTGAEQDHALPSGRSWKPMADWYRPDLRVTKLAPRSIEQSELRWHHGDDPRWAAPEWDDGAWEVIDRTQIPSSGETFWLRVRVRTTRPDEKIPTLTTLTLIPGRTARDLYWDGILTKSLGNADSGRLADLGREGDFELNAKAADTGEHLVALRVSVQPQSAMSERYLRLLFWTVPPEKVHELDSKLSLLIAMGVGAMLTIGIAAGVMWILADRRPVLALFAALSVSAAFLVAVASAPMMWTYPTRWGEVQRTARIIMVIAVSNLLLVTAVAQLFPSWRRRWWLLPLLPGIAITCFHLRSNVNVLTPMLWREGFILTLLVAIWGVRVRRPGAWMVLWGVAATYLMFERDPKHFEHSNFILAFLPLVIGLIGAIALNLRQERLRARDTKLMAARLEIELLKKSLQPHFLLNTLTALSQVIEEKPAAAVRLIEDLALEFRSLARFSDQKQVLISEELALCRAHLGVMSARTSLPWSLSAEGIDATASVPPALFLTLIENGFSHQRAKKDSTTFTLRAERTGELVRYIFLSPGVVTADEARVIGGTGLRYVCARLEESFHGAWKLTHGAVPGGWETVIELLRPAQRSAGA